jgi:hypothetical protein
MGLRWRKGRPYLYEAAREGGSVRTRYVASGDLALLLDEADALIARQGAEKRRAESLRVQAVRELDAQAGRFARGVRLLYELEMADLGYHRHDRGTWRRRRMAATRTKTTAKPASGRAAKPKKPKPAPAPAAPKSGEDYTHDEMQAVVDRAWDGDKTALPELRALLRSKAWGKRLLSYAGDPAVRLTDVLIARFAGDQDLATKEAMGWKMEAVERELTPPDAGPLERLLARAVALTWLAWCVAEKSAAARGKTASPRELEALGRFADRAHRRLMASSRALASYRKAESPGLVVNVSTQAGVAIGSGPAAPAPTTAAHAALAVTAGPPDH